MSAAPAHTQVLYGSIVGTVQDPSGAVVPKAAVSIVNKETGQAREALADEGGMYTILNVLPGKYDLKVSAPGFRQSIQNDVEVAINSVTRITAKLEVGQATEQVTVSGTWRGGRRIDLDAFLAEVQAIDPAAHAHLAKPAHQCH